MNDWIFQQPKKQMLSDNLGEEEEEEEEMELKSWKIPRQKLFIKFIKKNCSSFNAQPPSSCPKANSKETQNQVNFFFVLLPNLHGEIVKICCYFLALSFFTMDPIHLFLYVNPKP